MHFSSQFLNKIIQQKRFYTVIIIIFIIKFLFINVLSQ
jgi:hypothetical protein